MGTSISRKKDLWVIEYLLNNSHLCTKQRSEYIVFWLLRRHRNGDIVHRLAIHKLVWLATLGHKRILSSIQQTNSKWQLCWTIRTSRSSRFTSLNSSGGTGCLPRLPLGLATKDRPASSCIYRGLLDFWSKWFYRSLIAFHLSMLNTLCL